MCFRTNLKKARATAGLTQEQLAATSGVPRSTIAKLEAAETEPNREPSSRTLRKLTAALGITADELLRDAE